MISHPTIRLVFSLALVFAVLTACASAPNGDSFFIAPDFRDQGIRDIALLPVTFEERYAPPYPLDLAGEIESRAAAALEEKGYRVSHLAPQGGADVSAPVMAIHVDFLFVTETYDDITPPPVIDIEAAGRLVSATTGEVLWRDRGIGKVGGVGEDRIRRPVSARYLALTLLVENLLDSLPEAPLER